MKKLLARIGITKKTCSSCKHFNLAAGQEGIRTAAPAFVAAAAVLSPEQIAATAQTEDERAAQTKHIEESEAALVEGLTPPPLPAILVDAAARGAPKSVPWKLDEFGACSEHPDTAYWQNDVCEKWA